MGRRCAAIVRRELRTPQARKDGPMQPEWLILFDIDGTLLNSGGCGRAATRLALDEVFGTAGEAGTIAFAGKTDWQITIEALASAGVARDEIDARLDDYNVAVTRHLSALIDSYPVRACPGAHALVAALKARGDVLIGLVTGNMTGLIPVKLRTAGFDPADFRVGAFGSDGWERSMLPPLALARAEALAGRPFPPERVVIIGDTPGDIACAASIGARTLAVATGPFTAEQLRVCGPTYVFDTLAETETVLGALFRDGAADLGPGAARVEE